MAERKLFAGHAVRRLRRGQGLTQAAMAEMLGVSASYLNLVERNQRPLSATLLLGQVEIACGDAEHLRHRRLGQPLRTPQTPHRMPREQLALRHFPTRPVPVTFAARCE